MSKWLLELRYHWEFSGAKKLLRCMRYTLRHKWYMLWIRKDEFHKSLDIDMEYVQYCKVDLNEHLKELSMRREIAHNRDLRDKI